MFSFSSPSGLAHKISSRPCVLETARCHLRGSHRVHLRGKQQVVLVRIQASSLFSPPTLVCFSIPSPIFLKMTLPKRPSAVLRGHKHHLLFLSSHNVAARGAKFPPNPSVPRNAGCPLGSRRACPCWGRTAERRALGLGLHRMNNFPLKVTHFLFSVFRQSGEALICCKLQLV